MSFARFKLSCIIVAIIAAIGLGVWLYQEHLDRSRPAKKVLVIHSYQEEYPTNAVFSKFLKRSFNDKELPVEIRDVYLDCERYNNEEELVHMNQLLKDAQREHFDPDLIMVNDDQGCYSFLSCGHEWTHSKPIVFGGVNFPNQKLLAEHPNVTGFQDKIELGQNLALIDRLQKKRNPYYYTLLFLDSTFLEKKARKLVQAYAAEHSDEVDYIDRNNLVENKDGDIDLVKSYSSTNQDFLKRINEGHQKKTIFCTRIRKAPGANLLWMCVPHDSITSCYLKLTANIMSETAEVCCQMPKFTAITELFGVGRNYVAGYITTLNIQADEMTDVAIRIFNGEKPSDIPVKESGKEYVADWEALLHFHIDPKDLPEGCRIVNMPYYERNKWWIIPSVIAAFLLNTLLLLSLNNRRLKEKREKKEAQDKLAERNIELVQSLDKLRIQYEELQEVRKLVEKAELKQSFLDSMNHEIRTPLNAIMGFSAVLIDNEVFLSKEEKDEVIGAIRTNGELLLKLVNDVMEVSKLESGTLPVVPQPYSVQTLLSETFNEYGTMVKKDKKYDMDTDHVDAKVMVDPSRFKEVMSNLISNANKFTKPGGEVILGSRVNESDHTVSFFVCDTGIGIAKEHQQTIFFRFYKVDPFKQGSGLGLSICQTIVDKLKGAISVKSELGKGSTFTVTLPLAPKDEEKEA